MVYDGIILAVCVCYVCICEQCCTQHTLATADDCLNGRIIHVSSAKPSADTNSPNAILYAHLPNSAFASAATAHQSNAHGKITASHTFAHTHGCMILFMYYAGYNLNLFLSRLVVANQTHGFELAENRTFLYTSYMFSFLSDLVCLVHVRLCAIVRRCLAFG